MGVSVTCHDDLQDARRLRDVPRCLSEIFSVGFSGHEAFLQMCSSSDAQQHECLG
ncbi:hypothetical protein CNE_2c11610 [Cupriavidus necator N-1]|uniref:Uncharacterized protein n=1 Tax=Cupriavidus necator (strain ATCC 43291 / DSM 13513 / CCUG 52238 / LMG 8453 / N-1) TaxID=1042878 RepID=F8GMI9_CUPNN|nr:hypothetical protein CNE_2c11610 [Cupriavidus necator N-1]KAI3599230.1 hypothetical protein D8I24_4725 [Cupriavidus necator H850]